MFANLQGFPVLAQVNEARLNCFKVSHDNEKTNAAAFANWLGHKALTVVALPGNLAGIGIGAAGMVVSACTVGALKVAIYAITVGNVKPSFQTGFIWSGERTLHSADHFIVNIGELIYDAANVVYLGYRGLRWIGEKLYLENFINEVFRQLGEVFKFIGNEILVPVFRFVAKRIEKGIDKAVAHEGDFEFRGKTPSLIKPLDDLAKENRIDPNLQDRPLINIFKHYVFSIPNIPVNAVVAAGTGAASIILGSVFVGKVALYAATNIEIPCPTFAGQAIDTAYATTRNACADIGTNIGDGFVLLYKTSSALGINRVVATAMQILRYIPEAIFS